MKQHDSVEWRTTSTSPRLRVLIISDDPTIANRIALVLRFAGHYGHKAATDNVDLGLPVGFKPQALIVRLSSTNADAYRLIERVREFVALRSIRPIVMIGVSDSESDKHFANLRIDHFARNDDPGEIRSILDFVAASLGKST